MADAAGREASRAFVCPQCGRPANAVTRGVAVWDGHDTDGDLVNPPAEWTLVQCDRCWIPSVELREDYGRGFEYDEPLVVLPAAHRISPNVPAALRREWEEARTCLDHKAYTACVVMVRRTLEGTCQDQGVKKPTLAASLGALRSQGLIDGTLADWADALRVLGNQGAHYTGKSVTRADAEDSLAFAEALLDHLYVLRKRFTEFQGRLQQR
jgi:hypothetical protein